MEIVSRFLLTFLINAGWQIALITSMAAACAWILRKSTARYRHILWVSALALALCVPVLTTAQAMREAIFNRVTAPASETPNPIVISEPSPDSIPDGALDSIPVTSEISKRPNIEARPILIGKTIGLAIVALYLLLVLYRGIRLLRAWRRTIAIKRDGYQLNILDSMGTHQRIESVVGRCQRLLGINRFRILWSGSVPMPVTIGNIDPLVILPEQLMHETNADVLTSAIGHELVHIVRHDYILNLAYEFIYALLAFHPAVTMIRRQINQTRELGCDELVTEKLLSPQIYARSLVHLAGSTLPATRPITTMTVGMNDADILEERVKSMLKKTGVNGRRRRLLLVTVLVCLAVPCVAAVPHALRVGIDSSIGRDKKDDVNESQVPPKINNQNQQETFQTKPVQTQNQVSAESRTQRLSLAMAENRQAELDAVKRRAEEQARERALRVRQESENAEMTLQKQERELENRRILESRNEMTEAQLKELDANIRSEREAKAKRQIELVKQARINMQQAVRIATDRQPGTVTECGLARERDVVFYRVLIVSVVDGETVSTRLSINAIDGRIMSVSRE